MTKLLGEEKYFSLQRVSEAEFGDERNTNNRGMNVRSQLDFLAGHVFESTDLLRYLWADKVNEQQPPEKKERDARDGEGDRYK